MITRSRESSRPPRDRRLPIAVMCAVLLMLPMAASCGGDGEGDAKVVARVDGVEILDRDVRAVVAAAGLASRGLTYELARDQLVDEVLMRAEAEKLGIRIDEKDVDRRLEGVMSGVGGPEAFAAAIQAQGLSLEQFTARVRVTLLAEHLGAAEFPKIAADDHDARAYFTRHRGLFTRTAQANLGDISVKTEPSAANVRRLILAGQGFASAARQFSIDPESRAHGGRLGWITLDSLPGPVARAVARLDRGQLSRPVSVMGGWHVFKLYGRRAEKRFAYAEVRDEIVAELTRRRRAVALRDWLAAARREADIEIIR